MEEEIKLLTTKEMENLYSSDSYRAYINEIKRFPNLSVEKQKELGKKYQENKDPESREELINCNLKLVVSVAHHYVLSVKHLQILDLIQEGNAGLIRAVETYDPLLGSFTNYAISWIEQKIKRSITNTEREIRKPNYLVDLERRYLKLINQRKEQNLPPLEDNEICDVLEITSDQLNRLKESLTQKTLSINTKVEDDSETELENFIVVQNEEYDNILNEIANRDLLLVLKNNLSPLAYFIIYYRFLCDKPKTLEDVSRYFNITRERIRQIQNVALKKVKSYLTSENKFKNALWKLREQEKGNYQFLKTTPLSPKLIIKYHYLKNDLTPLEQELIKIIYLGKYEYPRVELLKILGISAQELQQIWSSIKEKINHKLQNMEKYQNFAKQMIKTYGTKIFEIAMDEKVKIIDYYYLETTYSDYSFEEIQDLFHSLNYQLNPHEEKLIERFFGVHNKWPVPLREIEKEINMIKFGFKRKDTHVPWNKLYNQYEQIKNRFSEEQQLYLETYIFNKKDKRLFPQMYPNSKVSSHKYYLINILERSYYHINDFFENSFNKEYWLKVRTKFASKYSEEKTLILDLYYGVKEKAKTITELSEIFKMDYTKMNDLCSTLRAAAIKMFNGINLKIEIDKDLYIPYVLNTHYFFTEETRNILKLFLIDGKSYEEIKEITGLNKTRISNIITEGIRKIDYYRFQIISPLIINQDELNNFFSIYADKFSEIEKNALRLKFSENLENKDIASKLTIDLKELKRIIARFNYLYTSYLTKDISITEEDIKEELNSCHSESILDEEQKEIMSLYHGITCQYNPSGKKLSTEEIIQKFSFSIESFYHLHTKSLKNLKLKKIGFLKPELGYLPREKLDDVLNDTHLPISKKEREIICHLFELKDYSYLSLDDLAKIYQEKPESIKRRFQRAIVTINKYLNKEIEGILHYETDILPIIKYFGISDRQKIEDFYKNGLTYEKISQKYNITLSQVIVSMNRIRANLKDLMINPEAKKFDFDYYFEAIKNPQLPFNGDLSVAIQLFDLVFGTHGERKSMAEAIKILNLDLVSTTALNTLYNLMTAVCKLKDGITSDNPFSPLDVKNYYEKNIENIPFYQKKIYQDYFRLINTAKRISGAKIHIPSLIINDLILATYPNAFRINNTNSEEMKSILKKYNKELTSRLKRGIMERFGIQEREFMNGKDLNHVYKILANLDLLRRKNKATALSLKRQKRD